MMPGSSIGKPQRMTLERGECNRVVAAVNAVGCGLLAAMAAVAVAAATATSSAVATADVYKHV